MNDPVSTTLYCCAAFAAGMAIGISISLVLVGERIADIRALILHVHASMLDKRSVSETSLDRPGSTSMLTASEDENSSGANFGAQSVESSVFR